MLHISIYTIIHNNKLFQINKIIITYSEQQKNYNKIASEEIAVFNNLLIGQLASASFTAVLN